MINNLPFNCRSLLSILHEDILLVGPDYRVKGVNKDFLPAVGRRSEEIIGRHCYEAVFGLSEPCSKYDVNCGLRTVFETGRPHTSRRELVKPDGSKAHVDILLSLVGPKSAEIELVICAMREVTREVELERQLRHAQKMETIGTLTGGIAHDFNNILGIILGNVELALFDVPQGSGGQERLKDITRATHRAKELVSQILAFSRRSEQERKPLHISPVVKETLKLLRASLPSTIEIRQDIDIAEGDDVVMADPTQIHQVLTNLGTNAGQAMRKRGGVLEVSLKAVNRDFPDEEAGAGNAMLAPGPFAHPSDPHCPLPTAGSYFRLTVRDSGPGIDPAIMDHIFDPYFTTKTADEGTGLGLTIVHGIVKSHGGIITVCSEPGKGAAFQVFLPRLEETAAASERPHRQEAIPRGDERILFIDDEEALVKVGVQILERLGYTVVGKTNGIEALEAFRMEPDGFDLVITDQVMPGMTGVEFACQVQSIRSDMPIILCTGMADMVTPQMGSHIGFRGLLTKPLLLRDMALAVRCVLDGK